MSMVDSYWDKLWEAYVVVFFPQLFRTTDVLVKLFHRVLGQQLDDVVMRDTVCEGMEGVKS